VSISDSTVHSLNQWLELLQRWEIKWRKREITSESLLAIADAVDRVVVLDKTDSETLKRRISDIKDLCQN
jgi:hypothetical protein